MTGNKLSFDSATRKIYLLNPLTQIIRVTDETDPLFDERVNWPVNPALVAMIKAGLLEDPVLVEKRGEMGAIKDGRQRHAAYAFIAKEQVDNKTPMDEVIQMPCVKSNQDEKDSFLQVIATNELRTADTPCNKARKAQRGINLNIPKKKIAAAFDVKWDTVEHWLPLLDLHKDVQAAVDAYTVPVEEALTWTDLDPKKQVNRLKEYLEGKRNVPTGSNGHDTTTAESNGHGEVESNGHKPTEEKAKTLAPSKRLVNHALANEKCPAELKALIAYLRGEKKLQYLATHFPGAYDVFKEAAGDIQRSRVQTRQAKKAKKQPPEE